MTPLETAGKYMDILFDEGDLDELFDLFTAELRFKGPLYRFETAEAYINSLKKDPPEGFHFRILKTYVDDSSVCLIYEFSKADITTPMAQLFEFEDGLISKIELIFDATRFT